MALLRFLFMLSAIASWLYLSSADVSAQFSGLAHRVPYDANTLVLINPDKIFASPIANKENWREQYESAFASGATVIPPEARQFLLAANMDFAFMQPTWELAVANLKYDVSLATLAARRKGQLDRIEGKSAVLLPTDVYVVELHKQLIAAVRPGNRQNVARWLRQTNVTSADTELSSYLQQAIAFADEGGTPIIMAMDAQHVLSAYDVEQRLESNEALKGRNVDGKQLAEAISSMHGITLGITFGERVFGALKIDFEKDISGTREFAKELVLETLANHGLMIDEFAEWELSVTTHQIKIQGRLYPSGLRRILSLVNAPASMADAVEGQESHPPASPDADAEKLAAVSSQQYFQSVGSLVDELKKKKNVKTMGQVGIWFDRYARRIDELPLLHVDPMLLDYGAFVSDSLRQAETSLRDTGGRQRVRQMNAPAQYDTYGGVRGYGRWGGYGFYGGAVAVEDDRATAQNRARIATEERVSSAKSARDIMQEVEHATAQVRREMTQKYQVEF